MIKKEVVFHNEKYWRNMTDTQLDEYIELIFDYYRQEGFPFYPTDKESRDKGFKSLMAYDRTNMWDGDVLKQTMHGLGLAWSYFPSSFGVVCSGKKTPYEVFNNDDIFRKIIRKRLRMGTYMSDSGIRKMLKIYTGVQAVSNFRPTAAAAIYDKYAKNGVVWDMSGGWGGRLLGAITSGVNTYIATDPSVNACKGLLEIAWDFSGHINVEIHCKGSEDYLPEKNSLDLCFTSPPYFNLEEYSDDKGQSYIKYSERELWLEKFLRPTIESCHYGLKSDGTMAINIADIKGNELEADMVRIAEESGFILTETLKLALSNINLRNKKNKFKYEPIYIFKKWKY